MTFQIAGLSAYLLGQEKSLSPSSLLAKMKELGRKDALTGVPSGTVNLLAYNGVGSDEPEPTEEPTSTAEPTEEPTSTSKDKPTSTDESTTEEPTETESSTAEPTETESSTAEPTETDSDSESTTESAPEPTSTD